MQIAKQNYSGYKTIFLYPSNSLMIKAGLWIELEAGIGFIVGLGLASLLGQRTVAVILMIVLEVILTPLLSRHVIPHFLNLERAMVGLATAHLEPGGMPLVFGGGVGGGPGGGGGGVGAATGIDHRGRLRHRGLVAGLDGPWRLADDDQRRLRNGGFNAAVPTLVPGGVRHATPPGAHPTRRPRRLTLC
jgi:hypothetical protein